jgi:hypothetical protein
MHVTRGGEILQLLYGPPNYLEAASRSFPFEFELPLGISEGDGKSSTAVVEFEQKKPIDVFVQFSDSNDGFPESQAVPWRYVFEGSGQPQDWLAVEV